jgi:hypothetical protein
MYDGNRPGIAAPSPGWQQRRSGLQVYFCCCPFALLLAPFLIVGRLARYGVLRLGGVAVGAGVRVSRHLATRV